MRILMLLCIQKASKERPPDRRFYSCCACRRRPNSPDAQILLLLGAQKEWTSGSAGRTPPTEAKIRSPTPYQEHYQTNTRGGPPERLFLQSYTGDHGRSADRAPGGQPTAPKWRPPDADSSAVVDPGSVQRDATKSRILLLLGIQKAPKERPPNRKFYCCWASRRVEFRERRPTSADRSKNEVADPLSGTL